MSSLLEKGNIGATGRQTTAASDFCGRPSFRGGGGAYIRMMSWRSSEPPFEEPLEDQERAPDPSVEPPAEAAPERERGLPDEPARRGPAVEPDPDDERGL